MKFVKLRSEVPTHLVRELIATTRELSPSGVFRVVAREKDCGEEFLLLEGGKAHYSAYLFEAVQ